MAMPTMKIPANPKNAFRRCVGWLRSIEILGHRQDGFSLLADFFLFCVLPNLLYHLFWSFQPDCIVIGLFYDRRKGVIVAVVPIPICRVFPDKFIRGHNAPVFQRMLVLHVFFWHKAGEDAGVSLFDDGVVHVPRQNSQRG